MHQQAKIKKRSKGFFSRSIALSLCHLSLRGNQVIGSAFLVFLCFLLKKIIQRIVHVRSHPLKLCDDCWFSCSSSFSSPLKMENRSFDIRQVASDVYISKECSWLAIKEKHLFRQKAQTLNHKIIVQLR